MHISCPHCHAAYHVGPMIKNAVLVCHRCHTEFGMDAAPPIKTDTSLPLLSDSRPAPSQKRGANTDSNSAASKGASSLPLPAFLAGSQPQPETKQPTPGKRAIEKAPAPESMEPLAPVRKSVVIWPWLIAMLLLISATGFWYKKDIWLDHPWVRSMLMNVYLPVEVRNKDWLITPDSIQGHWLTRDDASQVLIIQGRVANLLYRELPPPRILVQFFDDTGMAESLGSTLMPITEPPAMEQVKHAPFVTPNQDMVPVEAQGERGFILVVESLPAGTSDFTLAPVASR